MIEFRFKDYVALDHSPKCIAESRELLRSYTDQIQEDLTKSKSDIYYLGLHLLELYNRDLYAYDPDLGGERNGDFAYYISAEGIASGYLRIHRAHSKVFLKYCFDHFRLDKSQVSRYMHLAEEFGNDNHSGFAEPWCDYSVSQLVELLSLSDDQRKQVTPAMTIAETREFKKSFSVATSQQDTDPDKKAVATSQRKLYSISLEDFPDDSGLKYLGFVGLPVIRLCDRVLAAEARVKELEQMLENFGTVSAPVVNPIEVTV